jgi:putative phage-type endonuclease
MKFSNNPQGSPEWLAERVGKLTASCYPDLMDRLKDGKPGAKRRNLIAAKAIERLTGHAEQIYQNPAMARGVELEPVARDRYIAATGRAVINAGLCTIKGTPLGASVDGLVGDDGLIEIKCPWSSAKHLEALTNGAHAEEYQWQVMGQLWITGRLWCDVVSFDPRFPDELALAIVRVTRDGSKIVELKAEVTKVDAEINALISDLQGRIAKQRAASQWGV